PGPDDPGIGCFGPSGPASRQDMADFVNVSHPALVVSAHPGLQEGPDAKASGDTPLVLAPRVSERRHTGKNRQDPSGRCSLPCSISDTLSPLGRWTAMPSQGGDWLARSAVR
ncbi:MAG: hypothetical protein WCK86_07655, partial [Planctomycetia bacterium]